MRTHVTALTCAVALAGAFGVASAQTDRATTISGCLERNAYDQYVLTSSDRPGERYSVFRIAVAQPFRAASARARQA